MSIYPERLDRFASAFGIAAARNQGIRRAAGELLLFIEADCIPQSDCLATLGSCVMASHDCSYFQLRLTGELSNLAGRAEELSLIATQDFLRRPEGRIRFLNSAGFAIRRCSVDIANGPFDERAPRGEDTLLLANLLRRNQLPLFVPNAVVRHAINMSVSQCLSKDVRSAFMEAKTHGIISKSDVSVRVGHPERFKMLRSIWKISKSKSIGVPSSHCKADGSARHPRFAKLSQAIIRSTQRPSIDQTRAAFSERVHEAKK